MDAELAKIPKPDTDVLKLDGSKAMTGDLDMGDHRIFNLKDPIFLQDVVNKRYLDTRIP